MFSPFSFWRAIAFEGGQAEPVDLFFRNCEFRRLRLIGSIQDLMKVPIYWEIEMRSRRKERAPHESKP